jgi:hypothetical protein
VACALYYVCRQATEDEMAVGRPLKELRLESQEREELLRWTRRASTRRRWRCARASCSIALRG